MPAPVRKKVVPRKKQNSVHTACQTSTPTPDELLAAQRQRDTDLNVSGQGTVEGAIGKAYSPDADEAATHIQCMFRKRAAKDEVARRAEERRDYLSRMEEAQLEQEGELGDEEEQLEEEDNKGAQEMEEEHHDIEGSQEHEDVEQDVEEDVEEEEEEDNTPVPDVAPQFTPEVPNSISNKSVSPARKPSNTAAPQAPQPPALSEKKMPRGVEERTPKKPDATTSAASPRGRIATKAQPPARKGSNASPRHPLADAPPAPPAVSAVRNAPISNTTDDGRPSASMSLSARGRDQIYKNTELPDLARDMGEEIAMSTSARGRDQIRRNVVQPSASQDGAEEATKPPAATNPPAPPKRNSSKGHVTSLTKALTKVSSNSVAPSPPRQQSVPEPKEPTKVRNGNGGRPTVAPSAAAVTNPSKSGDRAAAPPQAVEPTPELVAQASVSEPAVAPSPTKRIVKPIRLATVPLDTHLAEPKKTTPRALPATHEMVEINGKKVLRVNDPHIQALEERVRVRRIADRQRKEIEDKKQAAIREAQEAQQLEEEELARMEQEEMERTRAQDVVRRREEIRLMEEARLERLAKGGILVDMDIIAGKKNIISRFEDERRRTDEEEEQEREAKLMAKRDERRRTPSFFKKILEREHAEKLRLRQEHEAREQAKMEATATSTFHVVPAEMESKAYHRLIQEERADKKRRARPAGEEGLYARKTYSDKVKNDLSQTRNEHADRLAASAAAAASVHEPVVEAPPKVESPPKSASKPKTTKSKSLPSSNITVPVAPKEESVKETEPVAESPKSDAKVEKVADKKAAPKESKKADGKDKGGKPDTIDTSKKNVKAPESGTPKKVKPDTKKTEKAGEKKAIKAAERQEEKPNEPEAEKVVEVARKASVSSAAAKEEVASTRRKSSVPSNKMSTKSSRSNMSKGEKVEPAPEVSEVVAEKPSVAEEPTPVEESTTPVAEEPIKEEEPNASQSEVTETAPKKKTKKVVRRRTSALQDEEPPI